MKLITKVEVGRCAPKSAIFGVDLFPRASPWQQILNVGDSTASEQVKYLVNAEALRISRMQIDVAVNIDEKASLDFKTMGL